MTDVTSTRKEYAPILGGKLVVLKSGTTVTGATDTLTLNLASVGISTLLGVQGWVHTTDGSVIIAEAGTTAVASGVLTITTVTGNNNKRRVFLVIGE